MNLYVLLISRLTPIILWISACLVAGRFVYDALVRAGKKAAGQRLFAGVLAIGALTSTAVFVPTALLLWAGYSYREGNWRSVDAAYRRYASPGRRTSLESSYEWADALMHERRFADAERVLLSSAEKRNGKIVMRRETVLRIGQCLYYEGRYEQAENALRVASGTTDDYLRSYFLGRIAEKRGMPDAARAMYGRSLSVAPHFFPALD